MWRRGSFVGAAVAPSRVLEDGLPAAARCRHHERRQGSNRRRGRRRWTRMRVDEHHVFVQGRGRGTGRGVVGMCRVGRGMPAPTTGTPRAWVVPVTVGCPTWGIEGRPGPGRGWLAVRIATVAVASTSASDPSTPTPASPPAPVAAAAATAAPLEDGRRYHWCCLWRCRRRGPRGPWVGGLVVAAHAAAAGGIMRLSLVMPS